MEKAMKHIFTGFNLKGAIALPGKWRRTVKIFNQELERGATRMRRFGWTILVAALLTGSVAGAIADPAPLAGVPTEDSMKAFALQSFARSSGEKAEGKSKKAEIICLLLD
jgi:hypothetical protein